MLQRLLYKVSDLMSPNLHGFMRGRSTADCFLKCLSNANVTCRAFIDLKGAFDRANKDVIMEELVMKGVTGKLLGWIQDYLYGRQGKVWFQGSYSAEGNFELGTPQGGVLSPMLFNVLMDRIARHPFPQGVEVIIYADDILLQSNSPGNLKSALQQLEVLCVQMGLVINTSKTKFQTNLRVCRSPSIHSTKLDRVHSYKYLGAQISFKNPARCVEYVRSLCLPRLAPLRILSNRGLGVGVTVLRMFYISVIRSLIDYAAPVLVQCSPTQLKPLELVQNEAIRIILGCPKTAKIEVMRAELVLPSVVSRIHEITCRTVCRLIANGNITLQNALLNLHANPNASVKPYLRRLYTLLSSFQVLAPTLAVSRISCYPIWNPHSISIDIEKLTQPKESWLPHVLQDHFLTKLSTYPHTFAVHVYCDGSVQGSKTGCGLFIRDYTSPTEYNDTKISKRLPDHLSSTRAELYAIFEALCVTVALGKPVYLFVDSQSALYELKSSSPVDCDIVNLCLELLRQFQRLNLQVHFTWVPSHVGIHFNELADRLARDATLEPSGSSGAEYTYSYVKNRIRSHMTNIVSTQLASSYLAGSPSSIYYFQVSDLCSYTYGKHSASYDLVVMRLRLGYKYYWEVSGSAPVSCVLCDRPGGHALFHYVMECPLVAHYRPQGEWTLPEMVSWLITEGVLSSILKEYPNFAPRF